MSAPKRILADVLVRNASQVITARGFSTRPKSGNGEMNDLGIIEDGALAIKNGKIVWVGGTADIGKNIEIDETVRNIDAREQIVTPGLIDTHNHLIFAGLKEKEFLERIYQGTSYLEMAAKGRGVIKTVEATRLASDVALLDQGKKRAKRMVKEGILTSEAKSGYGLTYQEEIRILKIVKELGKASPMCLVPTLLAHGIPPEYKDKPDYFVDMFINQLMPQVAEEQLAKFCDVPYVPKRIFSENQCLKILKKANDLGLKARIHADEFSADGGAEFAARIRAHTVDHCNFTGKEGVNDLRESKTMVNLLPLVPFNLQSNDYANARLMIDSGVAVALGTDFNASFFNHSMLLAISLACMKMKMTPAEAINAATINAAHSVGVAMKKGSLEVGKDADILILDVPNYSCIPYVLGMNIIESTIIMGEFVNG